MTESSTPNSILILIARVVYFLLNAFAVFCFIHDIRIGEFEFLTLALVFVLLIPSFYITKYVFTRTKGKTTEYFTISTSIIFGLLVAIS